MSLQTWLHKREQWPATARDEIAKPPFKSVGVEVRNDKGEIIAVCKDAKIASHIVMLLCKEHGYTVAQ